MAIYRGTGGSGDSTTDAYASDIAQYAKTATTKANEAAASATAAAVSASNAASSEAGADADAIAAAASAAAAATSLANIGNAEVNAAASASNASTSASNASTSAANAATSESNAATSATNASNSASAASASASAASTSASNAATSETNASNSASAASTSAANAATSASNAATSASNASTSETNAANSAAAAAASYDSFDDRYLGAKASDPTLDNDGNALLTGALYFDSTNNVMKVYSGTDWQNASSSIEGIKADFVYTATASQTLFSGADDNTNTLVIDQAGLVNVYLNGVRLLDADYTVNVGANSVTLTTGAALNDVVEIEVFGNFAGQSGAAVAITGGLIDGTVIGSTTPAAGSFTTLNATGSVGIGTASPTFDAGSGVEIRKNGTATLRLYSDGTTDEVTELRQIQNGDFAILGQTGQNLQFHTSGSERVRIDSSGNVGIGTSSPLSPLTVTSQAASNVSVRTTDSVFGSITGGTALDSLNASYAALTPFGIRGSTLTFGTSAGISAHIDSSGNVGIGTTTPDTSLHVYGGFPTATIERNAGTSAAASLGLTNTTNSGFIVTGSDEAFAVIQSTAVTAGTGLTERMRIDTSGRAMVGATDFNAITASTSSGTALQPEGTVWASRVSDRTAMFNRRTTDGDIVSFLKDGTFVGSIGSNVGELFIASPYGSAAGLKIGNSNVSPATTTGAARDAAIDLGYAADRFKDLYLSGGVYLGGTGAANHLDDYEEGTFTPVFTASVTNPTVTYTKQEGKYTKIGDRVFYTIDVRWSANSGGAGSAYIGGLPFVVNATGRSGATLCEHNSGVTYSSGRTQLGFESLESTSSLIILESGSGLSTAGFPVTSLSASGYLIFSGSYQAA